MAQTRNVKVNLDEIIESVDICIGAAKDTGNQYRYLSLQLANGEELRWFPTDRSLLTVLEQEVELTALREKKA